MAKEIADYGRFHDFHPIFCGVWIDHENIDVEEVRQWLLDPARPGDFYLSRTSDRFTGISDLICLMSDENTAFEYKMRWC